jgi:hypothetical protein
VSAVTLDRYFADPGLERPALIKVDVEGAELQVLKGAKSLLTSVKAPVLIVEYGPANTSDFDYPADEVCEFLRELGYMIYQWQQSGELIRVEGSPVLLKMSGTCNLVATKTPLPYGANHYDVPFS